MTQANNKHPLLEIEGLHIDYLSAGRTVEAVVDFSLTIEKGKKVGLVGESGSGKSTIAYAIMNYMGGNRRIRSGEVLFRGESVLSMSPGGIQALRGNRISMIYQEAMNSLNPVTTIGEQMMEVPTFKLPHLSPQEGKQLCMDTLAKVRIKDPVKIFNSYPFQISGGQQQRVVIAMALMTEPDLLIMDEPTTSLDVTVEAEIMELVEELVRDYGTALLLISHNLGLVINTCDDICVLYSGQIVEKGSTYNIFYNPQHPYTGGLFKCIPRLYRPGRPTKYSLEAIPGQLPLPWARPSGCWFKDRCTFYKTGECDQDIRLTKPKFINQEKNPPGHADTHLVRCIRNEEIELFPPSAQNNTDSETEENLEEVKNLIELKDVVKRYPIGGGFFSSGIKKYFTASREVSFQIKEGEIISIVGESGSGKSTLAKMIVGLEKTSSGKINFKGQEIGSHTARDRDFDVVRQIQMIFQNPTDVFNPKLKIRPQIVRTINKLLKIKKTDQVNEIMTNLMEVIRMPVEYLNYRPDQLSGGQKQRVAIARTFAGNPSFVVADEPTSALDVSVQASIVEMLLEMQTRHRNTLFFISHDLSLVSSLSDRVVVLFGGKIMEIGPTPAIFSPPYHPYTAVLISATPDLVLKRDQTGQSSKRISLSENEIKTQGGCPFARVCSHFIPGKCDREDPPLRQIGKGHYLACHLENQDLESIKVFN